MEQIGDGFEGDLEDYDPVAAAAEDAAAIKRVLESPDVDPEFKARVLEYANGRRHDLEGLGHPEAASRYDMAA